MKVRDIIERVSARYNDKEFIRVDFGGYLEFLDDSITQLIMSRPDSHVKTEVIQLIGGTRQSIPEDGYSLISINRNMNRVENEGSIEYIPTTPVLQVNKADLDYFGNWHELTPTSSVVEFAYDKRVPKTFWVSQPIAVDNVTGLSNTFVELDYSYGIPSYANLYLGDNVDAIMDMDIPLDRVFMGAIINYMLYLLYSVDDGSTIGPTLSQRYEKSFYQTLGIEYQASVLVEPKTGQQAAIAASAAPAGQPA